MAIEIDSNNYDAITFDCYGTLIDWEAGLTHYLRPLLLAHDCHAVDGFLLEFFGRTEAALQAGRYRAYRHVLMAVLAALGERLGFRPSPQALEDFPESIGDWLPFPDTVPALNALAVADGRILHVAQSLYHDIAPATALGFDTVWIDRHDGHGGGATLTGQATPTWTLRNLSELVAALKVV